MLIIVSNTKCYNNRRQYLLCVCLFQQRAPEFVWRGTVLSKAQLSIDCHRETIVDYHFHPFPEAPEIEVKYSWKENEETVTNVNYFRNFNNRNGKLLGWLLFLVSSCCPCAYAWAYTNAPTHACTHTREHTLNTHPHAHAQTPQNINLAFSCSLNI